MNQQQTSEIRRVEIVAGDWIAAASAVCSLPAEYHAHLVAQLTDQDKATIRQALGMLSALLG